MENEDQHRSACHSGSSSPIDPLAPLSDCAAGSLRSSWSSDESYLCPSSVMSTSTGNHLEPRTSSCFELDDTHWQRRCAYLQTEFAQFQNQAACVKNSLHQKLSEMKLRVADAELRAEEAQMRVHLMEEKLLEMGTEWPSPLSVETPNCGPDKKFSKLAHQVEEQRQLRIQDAKFVEAKAAHIKEWVTNKLRDLEAQNQYLREQNLKYNQQLELLRQHIAQLTARQPPTNAVTGANTAGGGTNPTTVTIVTTDAAGATCTSAVIAAAASSPPASLAILGPNCSSQNFSDKEPVYAQVHRRSKKHASSSTEEVFTHHGYLSAGSASAASSISEETTNIANTSSSVSLMSQPPLTVDIHLLATLPLHVRSQSVGIVESDLTHDYAEIYTPSDDKTCAPSWENHSSYNANKDHCGESVDESGKPPTPPLHRFPSWESRIYQVANEGLSNSTPIYLEHPFRLPHSVSYVGSGYYDISCPVYATVKGRASQICSSPFNGDSSEDSSDGEDHTHGQLIGDTATMAGDANSPRITNSSSNDNTDNSVSSSSPSKNQSRKTGSSLSPVKCNSFGSPSKNTSFESGISDDYAIPPDAVSSISIGVLSDWSTVATSTVAAADASYINTSPNHQKLSVNELCVEKCGHLAKLGGKLKTWRKRWFHIGPKGVLRYWKSQSDVNRKPRGEIFIDKLCNIIKSEGGTTFEISTPKKIYYLTSDSISTTDEWIKTLLNIQVKNATELLLSKENYKPTLQGWLTKVQNGHTKNCWCILIEKTFLYFKSSSESNPSGQINMKEAKVDQVEHLSDSDSDEKGCDKPQHYTIGIFPSSQPPIYLLTPSKKEMDLWLYHLTVVSGGNPHVGTQYEQLIQKLMETDGDTNNVLWKHPLLLHTKETITTNLTTLSSATLVAEALKLFKSCQLFMSVAVESTGIDYHIVLAQNALQQCLDNWKLQAELMCILVKQTSPHSAHKVSGVQVLSKLRHRSLFACDSVGSPTTANVPFLPVGNVTSSADICKSNPPTYVFLQGWQLLALAVSLFVPKDHKILWYLKCHISRNADTKSECGKYATYCERALQRTIQNGNRKLKPSRMEVLSILLKNPYHHSLPHSIPVHFLNGSYQVVGFDGSTTVKEFLKTLTQDTGCRDCTISGFTLFSDDPIERDLEHYIDQQAKLCDVISKWETVLREKGSGKFENTRVIRLVFKNRLYFKHSTKNETDREKLLTCYQTNNQIINGRFPLTKELALELAALMAQIDFGEFLGDKSRSSGSIATSSNSSKDLIILQAVDKFYPYRYRDNLSPDALRELQNALQEKWLSLKGRSLLDCIRIYLTCTRKWPYFGASLFQAKWKQGENMCSIAPIVWLTVSEDNISLLELGSMQSISSYLYSQVLTFGGCQDDFMLVINSDDGLQSHKLLFSMSKPKILELTLIIADYMNALSQSDTLGRHNIQPDILKAVPDHQLNWSDLRKYQFDS